MKQKRKALWLRGAVVLAVAAILLLADQIIKYFVLLDLKPVGSVTIINGLLEFSYLENTGAAFGLFQDKIWLVATITIAAFVAILILLYRYGHHTFFSYAASALLFAGGIGNLVDRIRYGFVVDFIHVMFFDYIFNFADCCITVGSVLFIIHILLISYREKKVKEPLTEASQEGGE